jgi:teichuronic acid biosynthesis glycosyltransferase TuaG
MKNNLVSIITPSYNSKRFIKDTIDSVLAQTYENWEMIIVDDNSEDNSVEYIKELIKDNAKIKLISLEKNVGAAEARNIALAEAQGRYVAFLDSDDIWLPRKLEKQIDFMQMNGYSFTFSSYTTFSEDGQVELKTIEAPMELDYIVYCKNTIIGCLTVILDKEQIEDFKMPNIRSSHDMALWLQIMKKGITAYGLNEVLAKYRIVSTSNTSKKYKAVQDVWQVYRKIEKINIFFSGWYFINYLYNAIKKRL